MNEEKGDIDSTDKQAESSTTIACGKDRPGRVHPTIVAPIGLYL